MPIRLKIMLILLGFFVAVSTVFMVFFGTVAAFYRDFRSEEASFVARYERERVGRSIDRVEHSVLFLSVLAEQAYRAGRNSEEFGSYIPLETVEALGFDNLAVGGGFWFEPYSLLESEETAYVYIYYDRQTGEPRVLSDYGDASENFETGDARGYRLQPWYVNTKAGLETGQNTVWTVWTDYDNHISGEPTLMATVGAGIYNDDGDLVGIVTVDWQFETVMEQLYDVMPTEHSFALLASPDDGVVIFNTYSGADIAVETDVREWYEEHVIHRYFDENDGMFKSNFIFDDEEYLSYAYYFDNGWLFSMQIPADEFYAAEDLYKLRYIVTVVFSSVLFLLITFYLISRYINTPLKKLTLEVQEIQKRGIGGLDRKIQINSKDEVGLLAAAFNKMTGELKESIEQSTREQAINMQINAELSVAAMIQSNMLPRVFPPFPDRDEFEIFAAMFPARRVGGDFYDFFFVDNNTLAVVIADVSDKGIHSAMYMAIARTLIRDAARRAKQGENPGKVFESVNEALCEGNSASMFVTAFLGYLNTASGTFSYVNAGHNPPLVRQNNCYKKLKLKRGLVLGVKRGVKYEGDKIELYPDDALFLYTDGVTEAMNAQNALFGETRLLKTANSNAELSPRELIELIERDVAEYTRGTEQADDITMLSLSYNGRNPADGDAITVAAKIENLRTVMSFAEEKMTAGKIPPKVINKVSTAIDEVFSNIAKFAYAAENAKGKEDGEVTVRVIADGKSVTLEFEDSGVAFDPLAAPDPDISLPASEREIGGLGIFMLKKLMDKVSYRREGERNVLRVWKKAGSC